MEIEEGVSALKSRGFAPAQFHIGMMHMEGLGVEVDVSMGMDFLHLAADQVILSLNRALIEP